jgi:hypothetical protein
MAWRRGPAAGPAADAVAELAGYAEEYAVAAERGDTEAAGRLRAVLSWMDMLRVAGYDSEVGELFLAFARDDRVLLQVRGGVA